MGFFLSALPALSGLAGALFGGAPKAEYTPQAADITALTNPEQLGSAYGQNQGAIAQQQAFVNALQGGGAQGLGSQAALTNMLLNQAAGGGPSPAQQQLMQATGQNIAAQNALMAGQRGASANAGMLARQAAQQGAAAQQQAVGQSATLGAQQALAAQQALQNLASQQVGQQQTGLGQLGSMTLGQQQALLQAQAAENAQRVAMQSNINETAAGIAKDNAARAWERQQGLATGLGTAITKGAGMFGGSTPTPGGGSMGTQGVVSTGGSTAPSYSLASPPRVSPAPEKSYASGGEVHPLISSWRAKMSKGGEVPVAVSPGEVYLSPRQAREVVAEKKDPLKIGRKVPGKARVPGDNEKNDTVHTKLEVGGVVIPRSVVQKKDPHAAAKFVAAAKAKKGKLPR